MHAKQFINHWCETVNYYSCLNTKNTKTQKHKTRKYEQTDKQTIKYI